MAKYLKPSYTQMEYDSLHSNIKRKLKNRDIHLPNDYVTTRQAKYCIFTIDDYFLDQKIRSIK